jgi:hypothetical protein
MESRSSELDPRQDAASDPDVESVPWVTEGVLAGLAGAAVIALFFLVYDLAQGQPFWTPHALGAAIFEGAFPPPDDPIDPALVGGYTAIHCGTFVAVGVLAAFELFTGTRLPGSRIAVRGLVLAAILFVAFEAIFLVYSALMAPEAMSQFGVGRIALANGLAAIAMAWLLATRAERIGLGAHPAARRSPE